jgi:hypothetical protein
MVNLARNMPLTARRATISRGEGSSGLKCASCLKPLQSRRANSGVNAIRANQRFCDDKCRLLSWAANTLLKAVRERRADGLKGLIGKLTEEDNDGQKET